MMHSPPWPGSTAGGNQIYASGQCSDERIVYPFADFMAERIHVLDLIPGKVPDWM